MSLVVCLLLPRFELTVAAGERAGLLQVPAALAPEPGAVQQVGEVSLSAEAFGIHAGMRMGEAMARCPRLMLVPPDPAGVADAWERLLVRLESIGAAVESERPGLASFDADGLLRLHGGIDGVLTAARRALRTPARFGVGPSRFAAVAAATRARPRRPEVVPGTGDGQRWRGGRIGSAGLRATSAGGASFGDTSAAAAYLSAMPVSLLRARRQLAHLPDALERLGVNTLGELAALPEAAVADRFGVVGLQARMLARGKDAPLRPRQPAEILSEELELPEAVSGPQLERALALLVDRVLARRERRGRTLRRVILSAQLVEEGGTWRQQVSFREALADPVRMRLALVQRLTLVPAPAERLRLAVERFGPVLSDQRGLLDDPAAARAARLREAIRQARAAAGPEAALRVLEVDPDSRFPERRAVLTPFER